MKKYILLFLLLTCQRLFAQENYRFLENKNQWDENIRYKTDIENGFLFLQQTGWHLGFYDGQALAHHHDQAARTEIAKTNAQGISVKIVGANPTAHFLAENPTADLTNFFIGENPEKWASGLQNFQKISYQNIYKGIDLRFFTQKNRLKYEWIVAPNANPSQIRLHYEGADKIEILGENLKISHQLGYFQETELFCYQVINGQKKTVKAKFVLENKEVSLKIGAYNPNYELIIDPTLVFSSYSGSKADNWGNTATYDESENLYSAGLVFGANFPVTTGAFQVNFGGSRDIGILKFSPDGRKLLYTTFLGGSRTEVPHSLIVNKKGDLVIYGTTSSSNFPTSANAADRSYNGGGGEIEVMSGIVYEVGSDIFVSILSQNGSQLLASTYLGGSNNDGINIYQEVLTKNYGDQFRGEVFTDQNDQVYIASVSRSTNFPTINANQSVLRGRQDAVVVKMNSDLSQILWSTYLGGDFFETGLGIKVNSKNEVYVTGGTNSPNFPIGADALNKTYSGNSDAFVVKYDANGVLRNGTFLGTSNYDQAYFVDLDTEENVYVLGNTEGNYEIRSANYFNGNSGQFIHKLNASLSQTLFSTRIGSGRGVSDIALTAFLVSDCGTIYVAGWGGAINNLEGFQRNSSTNNLPITSDAYQKNTDGSDFYMMILEKNANSLVYGSYFGGINSGFDQEHVDGGTSRFSKRGKIYHAVCACRNLNMPVTPFAVSNVNRSTDANGQVVGCNNAAFKLELQSLKADIDLVDEKGVSVRKVCAPFLGTFQNKSINGIRYEWDLGEYGKFGQNEVAKINFTKKGTYIFKLTAYNDLTCLPPDVDYDTLEVFAGEYSISANKEICFGESVQLQATGGASYSWTPTTGLSNSTIANPIATPEKTTTYKVKISTQDACQKDTSVTIKVGERLEPKFDVNLENLCENLPTVKLLNLSSNLGSYEWDLGNGKSFSGFQPPSFKYEKEGVYTVKLKIVQANCNANFEKNITINAFDYQNFYKNIRLSTPNPICIGGKVPLQATGGTKYLWTPATGLSDATIANPMASPVQTTIYKVRIFDVSGCYLDTSLRVEVLDNIIADFEVKNSVECGKKAKISLTDKTKGVSKLTWHMGDGKILDAPPSNYEYEKSGIYTIRLDAKNAGCSASKEIQVAVDNVVPPNVITPNGDGKNDTFVINNVSSGWKLEIFDRWGKRIYQSDNYQNDWGGTSGASTVFFYRLISPDNKVCQGWVQVIGK